MKAFFDRLSLGCIFTMLAHLAKQGDQSYEFQALKTCFQEKSGHIWPNEPGWLVLYVWHGDKITACVPVRNDEDVGCITDQAVDKYHDVEWYVTT